MNIKIGLMNSCLTGIVELSDLKYKDANNLLNTLLDDKKIWNGTLDQIAFLREKMKSQ